MRTNILMIFLILLMSKSVAQSFDFYTLAGASISQIDGDRLGGYNKAGPLLGIGIRRALSDKTQVTLELDYIQKGKRLISENDNSNYKTILNYIDLPLLLHYNINTKYSIDAGLSVGTLISYKFLEDNEINEAPTYTPNRFDVDYILGGTYHITQAWHLTLRLAQSLFPMGNKTLSSSYSHNRWTKPGGLYNRSLCFAVQYNY